MNADIRLSIGFLDHPKTIKLKRELGWEGVESLLRLWFFAAQYKPDGLLSSMDAEEVEIAAKWSGRPGLFVTTIQRLRYLDQDGGCFVLHDWHEHNSYCVHASERKEQARRAAEKRWKDRLKNAGSNADSNAPSNAPSPVPAPAPAPNPKPEEKHFARSQDKPAPLPPHKRVRLNLDTWEWEGINDIDRAGWAKNYPGCNIDIELGRACDWVQANPTRAKTPDGWYRFLIGWLKRSQNGGGTRAGPASNGNGKSARGGSLYEQAMEELGLPDDPAIWNDQHKAAFEQFKAERRH